MLVRRARSTRSQREPTTHTPRARGSEAFHAARFHAANARFHARGSWLPPSTFTRLTHAEIRVSAHDVHRGSNRRAGARANWTRSLDLEAQERVDCRQLQPMRKLLQDPRDGFVNPLFHHS